MRKTSYAKHGQQLLALCAAPLLASLLAGCAFNPSSSMPVLDLPVSVAATKTEYQTQLTSRWWEQFNDTVLNQLIADADKSNQNLAQVSAKLDEARAVFGINSAAQLPRIDLAAAGSTNRQSENLGRPVSNPNKDYQLIGQASWELDLWGRVRNASNAARQDLFAAEYNRDAALLSLHAEVAQNYFNLRALDEQLKIAEDTVKSRQESYDLQKKRFLGGVTSELDVRQAEVELASTLSALPDLKQSIAQLEAALSILSGQAPRALIEQGIARGKTIPDLGISDQVPAQLSSDLLLRRADIAQAEANLLAARARIEAARAAYFPKISLTGLLGFESNDLGKLFSTGSNISSFVGNLSMPLFDNGMSAAQVDQAKARERQAAAAYQLAVQIAFGETRTSLISNQVLGDKVVNEKTKVNALQRQLRLANLRYENGYSSYLEALDAQRSLFNAQLSLISAQRNQINARVELYKSLGGGWQRAVK
ncbi:efflux transporter outer membrane subunit [Undibacterium parvum]|uniref:Efflux transporter outer membrane subunit n=1 Tax=Undibacterium parvum TaxID=401471 RepID=A0A3S9HHE4_9BURK|nr:efflux transporter outer membrane subunit [Undibacterium parvum]AZP11519.1 efflux transporter outer membrane subunit [Undibacterium parvum]